MYDDTMKTVDYFLQNHFSSLAHDDTLLDKCKKLSIHYLCCLTSKMHQ